MPSKLQGQQRYSSIQPFTLEVWFKLAHNIYIYIGFRHVLKLLLKSALIFSWFENAAFIEIKTCNYNFEIFCGVYGGSGGIGWWCIFLRLWWLCFYCSLVYNSPLLYQYFDIVDFLFFYLWFFMYMVFLRKSICSYSDFFYCLFLLLYNNINK